MKKLEEIKNEVAVKHGYDEWCLYTFNRANGCNINSMVNEVADSFDKDESLDSCSMSVILNTPNVVTTKQYESNKKK